MFSLSHTTGYAILALSCLTHSPERLVLAKEIADCTGIPLPYLSKILHAMRRCGLIEGKRGYRGGFALARRPEEMSLWEVTEAIEGKEWLPQCLLGLSGCDPQRVCPTHAFWTEERVRIENELKRVTLADVASFARLRGAGTSPTASDGDLECCAPVRAGDKSRRSRVPKPATKRGKPTRGRGG